MSRRTRNDVTEEVHVNLRVWPNVLTTATGISRHEPTQGKRNFVEMRKGQTRCPQISRKNVRNSGLGQHTGGVVSSELHF